LNTSYSGAKERDIIYFICFSEQDLNPIHYVNTNPVYDYLRPDSGRVSHDTSIHIKYMINYTLADKKKLIHIEITAMFICYTYFILFSHM
jgi:hypothetical protein